MVFKLIPHEYIKRRKYFKKEETLVTEQSKKKKKKCVFIRNIFYDF